MLHFLFASSSKHLQISFNSVRLVRCAATWTATATLLPREPKHTVLGEEGYSTSSSQILSRGFFFPDRRRRCTNSAEYSSITENELCMELAKYSTLPVSLSCSHSGTVCSRRLRPYSAIDAKELAGLVWSTSLLCSLSCRRSAHKHQRVTWLELWLCAFRLLSAQVRSTDCVSTVRIYVMQNL